MNGVAVGVVLAILVLAGVAFYYSYAVAPGTVAGVKSQTSRSTGPYGSESLSLSSSTGHGQNVSCLSVAPALATPNLVNVSPLFGNFSSMSINVAILSATPSASLNENASYSVVYANATVFKLKLVLNRTGESGSGTAWVLRNGTAVAFEYSNGVNETGGLGRAIFQSYYEPPFLYETLFSRYLSQFTASDHFSPVNTTTAEIGPSEVAVTNFRANALPESVSTCVAGDLTLRGFAFQTGGIEGSPFTLVTFLRVNGTSTFRGTSSNLNMVLRITSVAKS